MKEENREIVITFAIVGAIISIIFGAWCLSLCLKPEWKVESVNGPWLVVSGYIALAFMFCWKD